MSDRPTTERSAPEQADESKSATKPLRRKRLPLVKSISARSAINYFLYSTIILIMLWIAFFVGIYGFYAKMLQGDASRIGRDAAAAFPSRIDDNSSIMLYKIRLVEIARTNKPVAIAVFVRSDNKNNVLILVDDMGNGIDENNELFDSAMSAIDFRAVFTDGTLVMVETPYGTYLCCGSTHMQEGSEEPCYLLSLKPYDLWNDQSIWLVYTLVICTVTVLVLSVVFAILASRYQTKRLTALSDQAKRLADGDFSIKFSGGGYTEYDNLAGALNAATENMQKAENLQRDIIANVSHDIRTPLTMIRAYAEMLRDMPVDEKKRQKTAGVIITEADRLTSLVTDVLDYSRLQSGVTEFKFEPCDVSRLATTVVGQYDIVREHDGINLTYDIDGGLRVNCDKQKIERVLYNLLNNAINYCGEDKAVILRVKKRAGVVRFEVSDHGKGIAPDEIEAVWDRYYRTAHAKRQAVGSGLGLSICKSILTAHDAKYGIDSEIGKGSTFWFELKRI